MNYNLEHIKRISEKLKALPKIENKNVKLTKKEAVRFLSKEIRAMMKRGYSLEQVVDAFQSENFDITLNTLKIYLQKINKSKNPQSTKLKINLQMNG